MIPLQKYEKITTDFEPNDNEDVINKADLDEKLLKINVHLRKLKKDYNECKLQCNKQSLEKILIQRAVKLTIQILYGNGLFDGFPNADKVSKDFFFVTRLES